MVDVALADTGLLLLVGRAIRLAQYLGHAAVGDHPPRTARAALVLAVETLTDNGYEPRHDDGRVVMAHDLDVF